MAPHSNGAAAPKGCPNGALRRASAGPPKRAGRGWGAKPRAPSEARLPAWDFCKAKVGSRRETRSARPALRRSPQFWLGRRPSRNGATQAGSRASRGRPPEGRRPAGAAERREGIVRWAARASSPGSCWGAAPAVCPAGQPATVTSARCFDRKSQKSTSLL